MVNMQGTSVRKETLKEFLVAWFEIYEELLKHKSVCVIYTWTGHPVLPHWNETNAQTIATAIGGFYRLYDLDELFQTARSKQMMLEPQTA